MKTKSLMAILVSTVLLFATLPLGTFTASAETSGYYTYTISNGEATITDCDTSISGDVTIPSTLGGCPVTSIGDSAFYGCEKLTSIIIPKEVITIGNTAFCYCYNLRNITMFDNVTSIGDAAFTGCSLTNVNIPKKTISIGERAFEGCDFDSISIPSSVEFIGTQAFERCDNLTNIYVDVNNLKYSSKNGVLYNKNKSLLIRYPAGKSNCSYIMPESVTGISDNAFAYALYLKEVITNNNVTNISIGAFEGCSNLTNVVLGNGITKIDDYAFSNCHALGSLVIPSGVKNIGANVFVCCHSLTSIAIPISVTNIGRYSFSSCYQLCNIYYCGTEEQWNSISIGYHNECLTSAQINNHNFGSWIVSIEADCEIKGEEYHTCSACGEKETKIISALGHNYSTEIIVDKEPTDFEEGSKSKHCLRCDSVTEVTVIPKTSLADGICGENAKWAVRADGTLLIAGNGATDNYKLPTYAPWNNYSSTITQIIISNGITYIGNNNFGNFTALDKVVIENLHCGFGLWVFPDDTSKFSIYSMGGSNVEEYANSNGITLVKPENPNTPIAPVLKFRTESSVELTKIDGYEYSMDGVNWQIEPLFENLISGTNYTFYQRIAGGVYAPSEKSAPFYISTLAKPDSPIIESVDKNKVTLQYKEGFEYSINGINWQNSNVFNKIPFDTLICFYQRKTATETDGTTSASEPTKCIIASTPKVLVGESSIKVTPKENYEYCIDDMVWQDSNIFTKYIIPNETYTVYQRPKAQTGVEIFYNTEGITVCVNGTDSLTVPNATHLVWLKKILLSNDGYCSISADFNNDSTVDIRDLVRLKKTLATTISTKIEYNIPYISYAESQYSDLRVTKFTFTTDGMCSVDDFHYTKLSEQTEDSLVYNGEYYGNAEGGGTSGIFTINEDIITVTSAEEYNYGDLLWKFTVNSDGSLTLTEIGNDFEDMFITGTVYITE